LLLRRWVLNEPNKEMTLDSIDPNFTQDLLESDKSVWVVAQNLRLNGYTVTLPPISIRPNTTLIQQYADSGDLLVGTDIIEIKQRPDLDFNSTEEFPYSDIIVDVKHHYDSLKTPPKYYLICNSSLKGAIVVSNKTRNFWTESTRWDRKRGRKRTFYLVSLKLCHYWKFGETPKFNLPCEQPLLQ